MDSDFRLKHCVDVLNKSAKRGAAVLSAGLEKKFPFQIRPNLR